MDAKKGMLWTILKWIGRAVFAAFILTLIYFQAPIKVIAFFSIFLLAGIFLKKRHYQYFWFLVLFAVCCGAVWVFLPEDDNGWVPFAFEKDIQALNDKYAVPDSENAALIYNEIFAEYTAKDLDPNLTDEADIDTMDNPWTAEKYPQLAEWIKTKEPLIEKLKQAAEKEKCFFEIKQDLNLDMDSLSLFRKFSYLLVRKANNDIANGNIDAAIADLSIPIQIAKHVYQQPVIVDYLVAISIDSLSKLHFNEILVRQKLTDEQYNKIAVILEKNRFSWDDSLERVLGFERLYLKNLLPGMLYETKDGKYRFTRDHWKAIQMLNPEMEQPESKYPYWRKKAVKVATIFAWFVLPSTPDSLTNRIDTIFDEYIISRKMPEYKFKLRYENGLDRMVSRYFEVYEKIALLSNKWQDDRYGSLLVLEISKFKNKNGNWPQSLDELGTAGIPLERFIYKPIDEANFILYSIGENGIDDGGKGEAGCRNSDCEKYDDILIWPRRQAELDKLNINTPPQTDQIPAEVLIPENPGANMRPAGMPGSVEANK